MIFISSPYSSPILEAEDERFRLVQAFVHHCLSEGVIAFSPIAYCHPLKARFGLRGDAAFWLSFNMNMLRIAEANFVLCLPGWEKSKGVRVEISMAKAVQIPRVYFSPEFSPIPIDEAAYLESTK